MVQSFGGTNARRDARGCSGVLAALPDLLIVPAVPPLRIKNKEDYTDCIAVYIYIYICNHIFKY